MVALSILLGLGAGSVEPGAGAAFDRALARSLARAQVELESSRFDDHSTWDRAWEIPSESFRVRTAMNWYIGAELGRHLDTMLEHFRSVTRSSWRPPTPMSVFLFSNLQEYNQFGAAGIFQQVSANHSSILGSFYGPEHAERPVALYFDRNRTRLGMWATHSAFHQFAEGAFGGQRPLWFEEGLASYFSLFYWDKAYAATEFRLLVERGTFVPLAQLQRETIDQYVADPHARFIELGMLFAYLLLYREDTRTQLGPDGVVQSAPAADWVAAALRGADVSNDPVQELLREGLDELEADLKAFEPPR